MKQLTCLLIACTIVTVSHSQDYDSLKQKILKMDVAVNAMHYNMTKAHKQFKTGTFLMFAGAALSIAGTWVLTQEANDLNNNNDQPTLLLLGSGLMLTGGIIQIDSHKWFGYGGRRRE